MSPAPSTSRTKNGRVLERASGASSPTVLPFSGVKGPSEVRADTSGAVYVTAYNSVWELAAGASSPTALPFTELRYPCGLAVDSAGAVYVADSGNKRVLKLAAL